MNNNINNYGSDLCDLKLFKNFGKQYQNLYSRSVYVVQLIKNYKVYIPGIFIL